MTDYQFLGFAKHTLTAFEDSFLADKVKAVCSCGWKSRYFRDDQEARREFLLHKKEAEK